MQKLLVYQSMWAMERRAPDGKEWTLEEKLKMIRDAGFDGAGVRFFDFEQAKAHVTILKDYGLTWQAQCYPQSVDDHVFFPSSGPSSPAALSTTFSVSVPST